jgi:lysophospholipase L1-like esterase
MHRAAAVVILLSALAAAGACKRTETPMNPTPTPPPSGNSPVHYAAVGASDSIGFVGSAPCVPFDPDCPNGTGYVYVVKRRFQADGVTVQLSNRGVPGAVLSPAILALARDIGRNDIPGTFLDQIPQFIPNTTTHISIFAGGNDANVIGQNVRAGRGASDVRAFVDEQVRQLGTDLTDLIARLRTRAPNARIVAFNLPNLAGAPYVVGLQPLDKSILQRIAVGIADRLNALASQNVVVVDLLCEGRLYSPTNFSSDGFHPNDQGYALMAELLYPALRNGTAPTPSGNCPQRALVPVF